MGSHMRLAAERGTKAPAGMRKLMPKTYSPFETGRALHASVVQYAVPIWLNAIEKTV